MKRILIAAALILVGSATHPAGSEPRLEGFAVLTDGESKHLANARQVTHGLPRAGEGYFSPDGKSIVYQAYPIGYPFYQIYVQELEKGEPRLVSTGRGRTTCSYFSRDGKTILFA